MKSEDVVKYYHGAERYNCAQAILKGFQEKFGIPQEKIDAFRAYGAGRSEGNWCGALYSAKYLLNDPEKEKFFEQKFTEMTGGTKCKEIRKKNQVPCVKCVEAAAKILMEMESEHDALQ
ncbi:MAG: C-GCAxxG-C-C family (seleno)protein [Verrucomicrobiota bacterium]